MSDPSRLRKEHLLGSALEPYHEDALPAGYRDGLAEVDRLLLDRQGAEAATELAKLVEKRDAVIGVARWVVWIDGVLTAEDQRIQADFTGDWPEARASGWPPSPAPRSSSSSHYPR